VTERIPAIVNVASGTAAEAQEMLEQGDAFEVHAVQPDEVAPTIRDVVDRGAKTARSRRPPPSCSTARRSWQSCPAARSITSRRISA
jgi:hypothetical protein